VAAAGQKLTKTWGGKTMKTFPFVTKKAKRGMPSGERGKGKGVFLMRKGEGKGEGAFVLFPLDQWSLGGP